VIPNPTGLHARPAAVLASLAKGFRSSIKLQLGDQQANARSITAIMALDVRSGAVVHLLASGRCARGRGQDRACDRPGSRRRRLHTCSCAGDDDGCTGISTAVAT
jgi:Phosphotransferase System HPr (HPr) Family